MEILIPKDAMMRRKMTSIIKGTDVRLKLTSEGETANSYELVGDISKIEA